jgi:hypothetical protein
VCVVFKILRSRILKTTHTRPYLPLLGRRSRLPRNLG